MIISLPKNVIDVFCEQLWLVTTKYIWLGLRKVSQLDETRHERLQQMLGHERFSELGQIGQQLVNVAQQFVAQR